MVQATQPIRRTEVCVKVLRRVAQNRITPTMRQIPNVSPGGVTENYNPCQGYTGTSICNRSAQEKISAFHTRYMHATVTVNKYRRAPKSLVDIQEQ